MSIQLDQTLSNGITKLNERTEKREEQRKHEAFLADLNVVKKTLFDEYQETLKVFLGVYINKRNEFEKETKGHVKVSFGSVFRKHNIPVVDQEKYILEEMAVILSTFEKAKIEKEIEDERIRAKQKVTGQKVESLLERSRKARVVWSEQQKKSVVENVNTQNLVGSANSNEPLTEDEIILEAKSNKINDGLAKMNLNSGRSYTIPEFPQTQTLPAEGIQQKDEKLKIVSDYVYDHKKASNHPDPVILSEEARAEYKKWQENSAKPSIMAKVETDAVLPPVKIREFRSPKERKNHFKSIRVSQKEVEQPELSRGGNEYMDEMYASDVVSPGVLPIERTREYEIQSEATIQIEKERKIQELLVSWKVIPFLKNQRLMKNNAGINLFVEIVIFKEPEKVSEIAEAGLSLEDLRNYILENYGISTVQEE